mgnify:CR=1 FL=1
MIQYSDPLKMFLEINLDEIDYFKDLTKHIRCEFIYNMTLETFEAGDYLFKKGDESKKMYIIQSGQVWI